MTHYRVIFLSPFINSPNWLQSLWLEDGVSYDAAMLARCSMCSAQSQLYAPHVLPRGPSFPYVMSLEARVSLLSLIFFHRLLLQFFLLFYLLFMHGVCRGCLQISFDKFDGSNRLLLVNRKKKVSFKEWTGKKSLGTQNRQWTCSKNNFNLFVDLVKSWCLTNASFPSVTRKIFETF